MLNVDPSPWHPICQSRESMFTNAYLPPSLDNIIPGSILIKNIFGTSDQSCGVLGT
jgi:hypothetical protein